MPKRSAVYRSTDSILLAVMFCFNECMLDGLQHILKLSILFLFHQGLAIIPTRILHTPISLQSVIESLVGAETCCAKMTARCSSLAADLQMFEAMHSSQTWSVKS